MGKRYYLPWYVITGGSIGGVLAIVSVVKGPDREHSDPLLSTAALLIIIFAGILEFGRLLKRGKKEVEKFKHAKHIPNIDFLNDLNIDPDSPEAHIALTVRQVIAEPAKIPPESVRADHQFMKDFERLPFYDSPDFLMFIMNLEDKLNMSIPDEDTEQILELFKDYSVKDFVLGIIRLCREKNLLNHIPATTSE